MKIVNIGILAGVMSLILLSGTVLGAPVTTTVQVKQDTTLQAKHLTNEGACQLTYFYPYLKYDVSSIRLACSGKTITDAKLKLYNLGDYGDEQFSAYYMAFGTEPNLDTMPVSTLWSKGLMYETPAILQNTNPRFRAWDTFDVKNIMASISSKFVVFAIRKPHLAQPTPTSRYAVTGLLIGFSSKNITQDYYTCPLSNFRAWTSIENPWDQNHGILSVTCS